MVVNNNVEESKALVNDREETETIVADQPASINNDTDVYVKEHEIEKQPYVSHDIFSMHDLILCLIKIWRSESKKQKRNIVLIFVGAVLIIVAVLVFVIMAVLKLLGKLI